MYRSLIVPLVACACLWAQIPTNGLIAYYPFNGDANDASGKNMHCRVNGASLSRDRAGNANAAYSFNGVDNYVSAVDSSAVPDSVTISLWFKTVSANSSGGYLIGFSQSSDGDIHDQYFQYDRQIYLGNASDDKAYFGISVSGPHAVQSQANVNDGAWHHVAGWFDETKLKLYVDGVLQATARSWAGLRYNGYWVMGYHDITEWGWVTIGDSAHSDYLAANHHFSGVLDDVRIYNRTLSDGEIAALAAEVPGGTQRSHPVKRSDAPRFGMAPRFIRGGLELVCNFAKEADVKIALHSVAGDKIAVLHDGLVPQGRQTIVWNGQGALPGGTYLLTVEQAGLLEGRAIVFP
jgi:hypothetical protein